MATTKSVLIKLETLIEDLLEEEFETKNANEYITFYDKVYTRSDFRLMLRAIKRVKNLYQQGSDKSARYLQKNAEYNRTIRKITYYKQKRDKKMKDFEMLEELQRHLDYIKRERDKENIKKYNNKVAQTNKEFERYMMKGRDLEDEL